MIITESAGSCRTLRCRLHRYAGQNAIGHGDRCSFHLRVGPADEGQYKVLHTHTEHDCSTKQRAERLAEGDAAEWTAKRLKSHIATSRPLPSMPGATATSSHQRAAPLIKKRSAAASKEADDSDDSPAPVGTAMRQAHVGRPGSNPTQAGAAIEDGKRAIRPYTQDTILRSGLRQTLSKLLTTGKPYLARPGPSKPGVLSGRNDTYKEGEGLSTHRLAVQPSAQEPRPASTARLVGAPTPTAPPAAADSSRVLESASMLSRLSDVASQQPPSAATAFIPNIAENNLSTILLSLRPSLATSELDRLIGQLREIGITRAGDVATLGCLDPRLLDLFFRQVSRNHQEVATFFASLAGA